MKLPRLDPRAPRPHCEFGLLATAPVCQYRESASLGALRPPTGQSAQLSNIRVCCGGGGITGGTLFTRCTVSVSLLAHGPGSARTRSWATPHTYHPTVSFLTPSAPQNCRPSPQRCAAPTSRSTPISQPSRPSQGRPSRALCAASVVSPAPASPWASCFRPALPPRACQLPLPTALARNPNPRVQRPLPRSPPRPPPLAVTLPTSTSPKPRKSPKTAP